MTTVSEAWSTGRVERARQTRSRSTPLLLSAARWAGKKLPRWDKVRSGILQVAGLGFLDYAAWEMNTVAGLAAVGVSLFVLEWIGGDK